MKVTDTNFIKVFLDADACIVIGISVNHLINRYFWYIPYVFWFKNRGRIKFN